MRKSQSAGLVATIGIVSSAMLSSSAVWAQQDPAKQLVGTWTLVSATATLPDGKKYEPFGANGQGMLVFDSSGRYSLQICRPDRPKFASGSREKGTPEENQATVHGCNPHWGRYSVSGDAIVFHIEHAMYPNWQGIQQKRTFTIQGDQLKYSVPAASGGGTAEVVWKRAN
jgi:hypothetical protein